MQLTKSCTSYTTWFKVSRIRSILQPSYINSSSGFIFIHPGKIDTKKHDCPNQPRHPWYVGLLPEAGVLRKRLPKTVSTRKVWKSERTSLSSPKTSTWRFPRFGGRSLGRWLPSCLDHLTNPFPYHPNHSPMFPQCELPACPSSGSWDLKSGTSALRIPISIRNHCKGAPVAKAAPK